MLTKTMLNGHPVLWLENEYLQVAVLPEKGADIYEFTYKPAKVQFLMRTPAGLNPPGIRPPSDFLENYEGGWQELFPNANDGCHVGEVEVPFHGEVALLPWKYEVLHDGESGTEIRMWVRCERLPFLVERLLLLQAGSCALEIQGTITNESDIVQAFVWGHHIVLGGDFLEEGCRLEMPARTLYTPNQFYEPETARLVEGQCEGWPLARGRRETEWVDLREVPGPDVHAHDDVYVTGFERGFLSVTNSRLGLRFGLDWDERVFPWIVLWQPYGGADLPPLTGIYGLGIEPWVSRFNLAQAIDTGQACVLDPHQSITTKLSAFVETIERNS